MVVSDPQGLAYLGCEASSTHMPDLSCERGFGTGPDKGYWASDGDGIGAWVQVNFVKDYLVTQILIGNRENDNLHNKEIELLFSD